MTTLKPDLCILGLDPAGFDLALASAQLGASVVVAPLGQTSESFSRNNLLWLDSGQMQATGKSDFNEALRTIIVRKAQERSLLRLPGLGITVLDGAARFADRRHLMIGETRIAARRFVLATGRRSSAFAADGGLSALLKDGEKPRAVLISGGNDEAAVLAQIVVRAGFGVALDATDAFLPGIDAEVTALAIAGLIRDGVVILKERDGHAELMHRIDLGTAPPAFDALDLAASGIMLHGGEPVLDDRLRTSNARVCAIGTLTQRQPDMSDGAEQIGYLIGKLLLKRMGAFAPGPAMRRIGLQPEIVVLGMNEDEALRTGRITVYRESIGAADGVPGLLKVITGAKGRILGVTIRAERASEMAQVWALALASSATLDALKALPAMPGLPADASRLVALAPQRKLLSSPRVQGLVRFLRKFG